MSVTCLVTLSRPECVSLVKQNLLNLEGEVEELILVVDGLAQIDTEDLNEKYPNLVVHRVNGTKPTTSNIPRLRNRIAEVRNQTKELIGDTDFVFSFEDDSEVPKSALVKLLEDHEKLFVREEVGVVSGVQVGRHSRKILGAWHADDFIFPSELTTLSTKEKGLVEVDGTGFFCFLTPTSLYKSIRFGWKEPVGPDVWYGLRLRERGYANYVDTTVICPHHVGDLTLVPDGDTVRAKFYLDKTGKWSHKLIPH